MAQYETNDVSQNDLDAESGTTKRHCQVFQATSGHTVTDIAFNHILVSSGTAYFGLYAVDGSYKPTGSALASGSTSTAGWSNAAYEYHTITVSPEYTLTSGTYYAIVCYNSGGLNNGVHTPSTYGSTNECWGLSSDSGATWTMYSTYDALFKIFGNAGGSSGPANLKTWNGIAKASLKTWNGIAIASLKSWNGIV